MPLIDGMGDEVVHFGIAVAIVVVTVLAWLSTNARPDRYRAVIQMHARGHHAVTVSIRTGQGTRETRTQNSVAQSQPTDRSDTRQIASVASNQTENSVIPLQEMDSIVDADMAMINNNRLHFYRRIEGLATVQNADDTESTSEGSETVEDQDDPASNAQIREMDSIVSAMEADLIDTNVTSTIADNNDASTTLQNNADTNIIKEDKIDSTVTEEVSEPKPSTTTMKPEEGDQRKILIKLKYINDTLKEVEGSLDEPLKDFKCRHFSAELSSESRVRLIFNGRVLLDEGATLRACGLHHRAVVHCLVQPGRPANTQPPAPPERAHVHELVTEMINTDRYWDLENILMTLVSLALTVVWFFRCEYSNMFTASASVALFGLTVFYSVAIFGLYFSDAFHFERRPQATPQPAPASAP